jgi:hypothetical protein
VRQNVLHVLEHVDPREVFIGLNRLWEAGLLPELWGQNLDDFFWQFCY